METQIRERQEWSRAWAEAAGRARLLAGRAEEQPATAAGRLRRRARQTARLLVGGLAVLALTVVFATAARAGEPLAPVGPVELVRTPDGGEPPCSALPELWRVLQCDTPFFPLKVHTV